MPLKSYLIFHPNAKDSPGDLETLKKYLLEQSPRNTYDILQISDYEKQFSSLLEKSLEENKNVALAPNGISYIVYANKIAYKHTLTKGNKYYPEDAVLYEITWKLLSDKYWFGANIPEELKSVERLEVSDKNTIKYDFYDANLFKVSTKNPSEKASKILLKKIAIRPN